MNANADPDGDRYPGGKGQSGLHQWICHRLPDHVYYAEPFAGKGGIARHKVPALRTILIDKDPAVCTWWHHRIDGATPIVGHPPCRAWSRSFCHQAKPLPGEKALGLFVAEMLKQCGGVLEHPAHSHLFEAAGLPRAGQRLGNLITVEVLQSWWGFKIKKRTWLCFSHIDIDALDWPFTLRTPTDNARKFREMTTKQRSHTVPALAHWLINAARTCTLPSHSSINHLAPDPRPPIRPQQPLYSLICEICGDEFESHRQHADTCGPKCRKRKSRLSGSRPDSEI